jgi:N-acetylglucosamine kinase-like BadF-type ATPase
VGLDIGGTATRAWLARDGALPAEAQGGSASLNSAGRAAARAALSCKDQAAARIAQRAAGALAALAADCARRLGGPGTLPVILGGGLLTGNPELARRVTASIHRSLPQAPVRILDQPPVAGAVELALAAARAQTGP